MKHRHLTHETFTLAAIKDTLNRGTVPDWGPLVLEITANPFGEVADKTLRICTAGDIYGSAKLFGRMIETARHLKP